MLMDEIAGGTSDYAIVIYVWVLILGPFSRVPSVSLVMVGVGRPRVGGWVDACDWFAHICCGKWRPGHRKGVVELSLSSRTDGVREDFEYFGAQRCWSCQRKCGGFTGITQNISAFLTKLTFIRGEPCSDRTQWSKWINNHLWSEKKSMQWHRQSESYGRIVQTRRTNWILNKSQLVGLRVSASLESVQKKKKNFLFFSVWQHCYRSLHVQCKLNMNPNADRLKA